MYKKGNRWAAFCLFENNYYFLKSAYEAKTALRKGDYLN